MATTPQFAATPRNSSVLANTANTARDGSGTLATVFTAGTNGSRIERIIIAAAGVTTAGNVKLFIHNGTSAFFWKEVSVAAVTPSATVQAAVTEVDCSAPGQALVLPTGWSLRAAPHNAENFHITAIGGDY